MSELKYACGHFKELPMNNDNIDRTNIKDIFRAMTAAAAIGGGHD